MFSEKVLHVSYVWGLPFPASSNISALFYTCLGWSQIQVFQGVLSESLPSSARQTSLLFCHLVTKLTRPMFCPHDLLLKLLEKLVSVYGC